MDASYDGGTKILELQNPSLMPHLTNSWIQLFLVVYLSSNIVLWQNMPYDGHC